MLIYVVDLSGAEPTADLSMLHDELQRYSRGLASRACLIVGNKMDLIQPAARVAELTDRLRAHYASIVPTDGPAGSVAVDALAVSALTRHGVAALIGRLYAVLSRTPADAVPASHAA